LSVIVGANGSGKSTLFDVFSFLKESLSENVAQAVARRGGFRELVSRGQKGPIEVAVLFRESGNRLASYHLGVDTEKGRPVVCREVLRFREGLSVQSWHFIDFKHGVGTAITNESDYGQKGVEAVREHRVLDDPSVLAIKGFGQFKEFRLASEFLSLIENYAEPLSTRGDYAARVAQHLFENHRDRFDLVLEIMQQRVPGVERVEAKLTDDGRLVLRFQNGSFQDPFLAGHVCAGTRKMFAYLVLLYDLKPHDLLAVEAPENLLYPGLLRELLEEFRDYSRRGGQVFVSTHSPDFLNGAALDEIFWLVKRDGFTTARRASESELLRNLVKEGDLPGSLWKQGFFEGANPS
jgi:predicted ATPase